MSQQALFYIPKISGSATLGAQLTALGNPTVLTNATAVSQQTSTVAIPEACPGSFEWYAAEFPSTPYFGRYTLNVYTSTAYTTLLWSGAVTLPGQLITQAAIAGSGDVNGGTNPFDRLYVDHLFHGESRIWWRFADSFKDQGPYIYVLQGSYVGHGNAIDWVTVSLPEYNPAYLPFVNRREPAGKSMLTHLRVLVYTPLGRYVSESTPIWGNLPEDTYLHAKEITRKELLRLKQVSTPGRLLRRMRYGVKHKPAIDGITDEIVNPSLVASRGTGFETGYHPAVDFPVELTYAPVSETRGDGDPQTNNENIRRIKIRIPAQPDIAFEDIWVHAQTDERWLVTDSVNVVASMRGVPLTREATLSVLPRGHAAYKIPVSNLSFDTVTASSADDYPQIGNGCIPVNHNYDTEDALSYLDAACCGISGATVKIYLTSDYTAGPVDDSMIIAQTTTGYGGQWTQTVNLNAGNYTVVFEKPGLYGPDAVAITVTAPIATVTPPVTVFTSNFDF